MNSLTNELAPIPEPAWDKIRKDAADALREHLVGRRVVDFDGPHGLTFGAQNLGSLDLVELGAGVLAGLRAVQPLLEVRVPFTLSRRAVDDAARGAPDFETGSAVEAARRLAELEDRALLDGLAAARIRGLGQASPYPSTPLGQDPLAYADVVASGLIQLDDAAVAGPYALLLGSAPYRRLVATSSNYPPLQHLTKLLGGPVLHSRVLEGGLLVSLRGGDFRLTVGQDATIGYTRHDAERIDLYLLETFTFLVLAPEAVVRFAP
jgi:uncharacterized linocin/CFP29 family protein